MKKIIFSILCMMLVASMGVAQESPDSTGVSDKIQQLQVCYPRHMVGVRGGMNLSDMKYSSSNYDRYDHHWQLQGTVGLFGYFRLGNSHFAIRPEVSLTGRADSLDWLDVQYRMKANYLDLRLPLTYNFYFAGCRFSPYLMVAPMASFAYGGKISYFDEVDYTEGISVPVTTADINKSDASLLLGAGVDYLLPTQLPVMLSLEAGYNFGFCNTFAPREIANNPNVTPTSQSIIANPFLGAGLWNESRKNRGVEVALRVAIPIDNTYKCEPDLYDLDKLYTPLNSDTVYVFQGGMLVDTVYVAGNAKATDTIYLQKIDTVYIERPEPQPDTAEYQHKDCYTFGEMYALLTKGEDISDKRMCLFNINFDFDSYKLRPESKAPLNDVARMMIAFPEMRIKIIGHTDSQGKDSYNLKLSKQRSVSVRNYLRAQGIDASRIETDGFGEKYPIDDNNTKIGRFHNRRVEIEILNVGFQITKNK